ncbi:MAG: CoA transferase [Desulfobacterales bacterium]
MHQLPLKGIRVIDHGIVYTGTAATTMLADMGAEVIRVESIQVLQPFTRGFMARPPKTEQTGLGYPDLDPGDRPWDRWFQLHGLQRNKYGITLDLSRPKGVEIYKRLAAMSDIILDNFAAGVMDRLGIGYAAIQKIKPDIIMISASGFGATGPYKSYSAVGTSLGGMAGLASLRGYPDDDILIRTPTPVWSDNVAAGTAVFAVLTALHYRNKTGKGQFIDLAQVETFLPHMGESILEYTMNGRVPEPIGNSDSSMAPHGCYLCKGEDSWVTIAVASDDQWRAFCRVLGNPDWTSASMFETATARCHHRADLDRHVADWTAGHTPYEVMHLLQNAGVPAGPVVRAADLYDDPHLNARDFFKTVTHRETGTHRYPGMCFQFSRTPAGVRMPPNCLGEHNRYIFQELLGISREEFDQLKEENYIGDAFLPAIP